MLCRLPSPPVHRFTHKLAVKAIEFYRSELRPRGAHDKQHRRGILNRAIRACFAARSRVLFSLSSGHLARGHPSVSENETSINRTSLSELATIAARHPQLRIPLRELHAQLLSDDVFYLVTQRGSAVQIWAATTGSAASGNRVATLVVKQCWTAYRPQPIHAIREILRQICRPGSSVLLDCDARDPFARQLKAFGLPISTRFCFESLTGS